MTITDIQQQKKDEKRYSIFIDNKFVFGMTGVDVLYYNLKIGEEISKEKFEEISNALIYEKAKEKALKKLDYGFCTKKDICLKLKDEYSEDVIQRVIDMLEKYGYIDDERYAKMYVNDCIRLKGWGEMKIRWQLKMKGIESEIIDKVMSETDTDVSEKAAQLLLKKFKGADLTDYKMKQKAYGYLMQRGYTYDDISESLEKYTQMNGG